MTHEAELVVPPEGIVVRDADRSGCRVYAARPFAGGETIERAPVVELTALECRHLAGTLLGAFALQWGESGAEGAIALGYGAVYRVLATANARAVSHPDECMLEIVAHRAIKAGDEIAVAGDPGAPAIPAEPGTTIIPPEDVCWGDTEGRGRGVFAARDFHAGETVERTPCITFPAGEWKPVEKTILDEYGFLWGEDRKAGALPLGYGAVYNHSFEPNACYIPRLEATIMDFVAIRHIAAGDEIRTNYNRDPLDMSPVWFDVV